MRLLTYLLMALLLFGLAVFAAANWVPVTVRVLPGWDLVVRLPVLLFAAALLGALPASLAHSIGRWTWRRRLARTQAELETTRAVPATTDPFAPAAAPVAPPTQPLVVPPAGA